MSQQQAMATLSASAAHPGVPESNDPTSTSNSHSTPSGHRPTPASPSESVQARRERLNANFGARAKGGIQRSLSEMESRTLNDRTNLSGRFGDLFGQAPVALGKRTNRAESTSPSGEKIARPGKRNKTQWQRSKTHNFGQVHDLQHDFQTAKALLLEPPEVRVEGTDLVLEVADQVSIVARNHSKTLADSADYFDAFRAKENGARCPQRPPRSQHRENLRLPRP